MRVGLLASLVLLTVGCAPTSVDPPERPVAEDPEVEIGLVAEGEPASDEIVALVRAHYAAWNDEDLAAVQATLDPASPVFEAAAQEFADTAERWDLRSTFGDVTVLTEAEGAALVQTPVRTVAEAGEGWTDNEFLMTFELTKIDGEWRITGGEPSDVRFIAPRGQTD